MKKLDLGGLLVTVYRIVKDVSFINEVKREFVNAGLNEKYQKKIEKLDRERDEILKELK